jgi:hypothetical protein
MIIEFFFLSSLRQASTSPVLLERLYDLTLKLKRVEEESVFGSSRVLWETVWDAVKHGSSLGREESRIFLPLVIASGALNAYRLRTLTVIDVPEDPTSGKPAFLFL